MRQNYSKSHPAMAAVEPLETRQLFAAAPITITTISNASEAGPTAGVFRITRTSTNRVSPLTTLLQLGGTAILGSDYTLPLAASADLVSVTIPANATSTDLRVTPIDDKLAEPIETVEVTAVLPDNTTTTTITPPHASMTITDNDGTVTTRPVARAGGPYRVTEGRSVALLGSATVASGRTVSSYQWDFNYDGATFSVDATGATPIFSAATLDGTAAGNVRKIALRVIDSTGTASTISTSTVTVINAAPTAKLLGGTFRLRQAATVSFADISDVPADVSAGFTYRYDFNNDGKFDLTSTKSSAVVPTSYLTSVGTHTIRASITDKDGGVSIYTAAVVVTSATGSAGSGSIVAPPPITKTIKAPVPINPLGPLF